MSRDFYALGEHLTLTSTGKIRTGGVILPWNSAFVERIARQEPDIYRAMQAACPKPSPTEGFAYWCERAYEGVPNGWPVHEWCESEGRSCACPCH